MIGMIRQYVDRALRRARYDKLDHGAYCAEVSELQGVLAAGTTLKDCRDQVVEEWVLVRVSQGLDVPVLDDIEVKVSRAG